MQEIKLKVSNVNYGGCVRKIQNGLGDIAGIEAMKEKRRSLGYPPVE